MPFNRTLRKILQPRHLLPLRQLARPAHLRRIHANVVPIHGATERSLAPSQVVVLCVVRNGEPWIRSFIEHHLQLGFHHLVFLDNGSSDGTLEIARSFEPVTLLRTDLPFRNHNLLFRRYLVERFGRRRWTLTVDIDELWDYPFSRQIGLQRLLHDLREQEANAMLAHMLDLFAPKLPDEPEPLESYRYYDLSAITRDGLDCERGFRQCGFDAVTPGCTGSGLYRGGIRAQVFGLKTVWLSKMPLLFYDDQLDPLVHQHFSRGARIADTSGVLLHYKLIHRFREQIENAVRQRQYVRNSVEYRRYKDSLLQDPDPQLLRPTARQFRSVDQLVDEGFLVVSDHHRSLAAAAD